ncbi:MAG: hypothetical protein R3F34_15005 [Planctomycetota bacterium]
MTTRDASVCSRWTSRSTYPLTARRGEELLRLGDLPEFGALLSEERERFLSADEWRCHFHVPLDARRCLSWERGLATTADEGARTLAHLLDDPDLWGTDELHVEVETYTFDVLPEELRAGGLVESLARELEGARSDRGLRPSSVAAG